MRHLIRAVLVVLCALGVSETAMAQWARRGGGGVALQNRSYGGYANRTGSYSGSVNRSGSYNGNSYSGSVNRSGSYNGNSYSGNVNRSGSYSGNVNVNQNVNVNRNVNVNTNVSGVYHDNGWNWGSFAAGAATTAVVGGAVRAAAPVAVVAPPIGTVVGALPAGCVAVAGAAAAMYSCGSAYYRPYYQGTTLVYEVVTNP